MTEYEEWQNTPGRLGILVSKGDFKKGRYCGEETTLFRAEFKERPRQITTKVIIGKPDSEERIICNALWDTGCTDTCISQTVADELKLKEYGKKTMTDMTAEHLCTFYIADIKSRDSKFYFREERCAGIDFDGANYEAIIGMDIIGNGNFSLLRERGKWVFTFSVLIPAESKEPPFKVFCDR